MNVECVWSFVCELTWMLFVSEYPACAFVVGMHTPVLGGR
jgi:hypothetical protein